MSTSLSNQMSESSGLNVALACTIGPTMLHRVVSHVREVMAARPRVGRRFNKGLR